MENHTLQLLSDSKKYAGIGRGHFEEVYEVKKYFVPSRKLKPDTYDEDGYLTHPDGQGRRGRWTRYSRMAALLPSYVEPTLYAPAPDVSIIDVMRKENEMRRICSQLIAQNTSQNEEKKITPKLLITEKKVHRKRSSHEDIKPMQNINLRDKSDKEKEDKTESAHNTGDHVSSAIISRSQHRKISDPDYTVILAPAVYKTVALALPVYGLYTLGSGFLSTITSGL